MSATEQDEMMVGTKPLAEHAWLMALVGDWQTETEMVMCDDEPTMTAHGTEKVTSLGGLWAYVDGVGQLPNGEPMVYKVALGYDVSFKEYRGCMI